MQRRHASINLPIEIVRTIVAIVDTGSFTKAGDRLGLSQPAISAQIKRLQVLVAGAVFERVAGGVTLTDLGKLILPHARRLLQSNDQILYFGGSAKEPLPIRLGLSKYFTERFLREYDPTIHGEVLIRCDHSQEIAKGLLDGYVDIACLLGPPKESSEVLVSWQEQHVWVRGATFTLSPGAPVPLVTWPGFHSDKLAIDALQAKGLAYRVAFESSDFRCRAWAVASGLGLMTLPVRSPDPLVTVAREYYLPALPSVTAGVCVRAGFDTTFAQPLIALLARFQEHPDI